MSKVAALSVQSVIRPTTGRPVTPAPAPKQDAAPKAPAAPVLAPEVQAFASSTLNVLIQAQAKHEDPQPTHGHDDEHGHKPADPPPVVTPPVVTPPVTPPPVIEPPVAVEPPIVTPSPERVDPAVAPRLQVMLARSIAERDAIRQSTAAFTAFAAERQAFTAIERNGVATALLQGFNTYA